MTHIDIDSILKAFPEFLRAKDLVRLGVFGSRFAVRNAVKRGDAPPCIKVSAHKVLFPKTSFSKWLIDRNNENLVIDDRDIRK